MMFKRSMFKRLLTGFNRSLFVALFVGGLVLTYLTLAPRSLAAEVVRHPIPNSNFPIALAVETPATATTVYVSGQVPPVVDANADKNSIAAYGNTETQTVNVLQRIQDILTSLDLTLSDVVKMQAFLVADPETGNMDFEGFMAGYTQFFGTPEQPNLPARSTMEVAALVNPGWLVEIEVVALRMP